MERLIAYAKELVSEAEAVKEERNEEERRGLPVTAPPNTWAPGTYPKAFRDKLIQAVEDLYQVTKAIRDEGFLRVTANGQPAAGTYTIQELQEAIRKVNHLL